MILKIEKYGFLLNSISDPHRLRRIRIRFLKSDAAADPDSKHCF
jgi:hypothetical protein